MTSTSRQSPGRAPAGGASHSATRTLLAIARANRGRLAATLSFVALENGLFLAYPLFAGFAVDAILAGEMAHAASYAAVVLAFWLVSAIRRVLDTRSYTRIYADLAVSVVIHQRTQGQNASTLAARAVLAREFVDFFEKHVPLIATAIASMFGAAAMLLMIEPWVGAASAACLLLCLLWMPGFARRNEALHERVNNRLEREVGLLGKVGASTLMRHYTVLSRLRIWLSDREAAAYLVIGTSASLLFLLAIVQLSTTPGVQAGHVYAVMTYLWTFVTSLDEAPSLVDQLARLRNIGKRVTAAPQAT